MNEFSLISTKIDDNKQEKIAFIIDLSSEILKEDFYNYNGEKISRFKLITDEISNFIKLKDYFSSKPAEFALYIYSDNLSKEIDFCEVNYFEMHFTQVANKIKNQIKNPQDYLDLSEIFTQATSLLYSKKNNYNHMLINDEIIYRYILFYNRSDIPVINRLEKEYNTMTFIRLTNFYFDVIFLRKKSITEEDKKVLTEVYNSLTSIKPKSWYATEISGSFNKFKFYMSLLLANANQRIKLGEIDKYQKSVEEIIKTYIDNQ
jgi:hypothetical protein